MNTAEKQKILNSVDDMFNIDRIKQQAQILQSNQKKNRLLILASVLLFISMSLFLNQLTASGSPETAFIQAHFAIDDRKVVEVWEAKRAEAVIQAVSFPELPEIEIIFDESLAYNTSI